MPVHGRVEVGTWEVVNNKRNKVTNLFISESFEKK
jgi:hypothetical protein